MNRQRKRLKVKWKNVFKVLSIFIVIVLLFMFTSSLISRTIDYNKTKKNLDKIKEQVTVKSIIDDTLTTSVAPEDNLSKFDSYWKYVKMSLIDADFEKLKTINEDTTGWLEIKGTNINFPIVSNEDFYKTHSFDKSNNSLGWPYRVVSNSKVTLIMGNLVNPGVLLGSLDDIYKNSWKSADDNHIIRYSTEFSSSLYQIISVYKTIGIDEIKVDFENESYEDYLNSIISKSEIDFKPSASTNDEIITISTNSGGKNIVIHGKLIKKRSVLIN